MKKCSNTSSSLKEHFMFHHIIKYDGTFQNQGNAACLTDAHYFNLALTPFHQIYGNPTMPGVNELILMVAPNLQRYLTTLIEHGNISKVGVRTDQKKTWKLHETNKQGKLKTRNKWEKQKHETNEENKQTKKAADNNPAVGRLWWRSFPHIPSSTTSTSSTALHFVAALQCITCRAYQWYTLY